MIDSALHLTNQWSDVPSNSWRQVERWTPNGNMNQEQAKERKRQNKRRLVLEGGYVVEIKN